ncbi:YadA-like family protein [Ciceribacter sp. RN22]|nr:YadA-like family protein [Ciceribacter sp. RN22]
MTEAFSAVSGGLTSIQNGSSGVVQRTGNANETALTETGGTGTDPGAAQKLTNLAAGTVSSISADAINGTQLYGVSQSVATNLGGGSVVNTDGTVSAPTYNIAGNSYTNVGDALGALDSQSANAVQYDTDSSGNKLNSVTLKGGDPNAPVLLSNLATGVADTDAVNVKQLKDGVVSANAYTDTKVTWAIDQANTYSDQVGATTLNKANAYTDYKFGQLNQELGEVRGEARQAAAIGLAAASLRYDDRPGKASVAIGGGVWRGEGALAFGAGYTSEEGRVRANVSGTVAGGHVGVGAGLSFTLN